MTKQLINIGSTANYGDGDTLRDAMDKSNDNFTELYSRQSPVSGQSSELLTGAVKYFEVNDKAPGELFFISELNAHIASGPNFQYYISVWMSIDTDAPGDEIMRFTETVGTKKTGYELIRLPEYDGSGYYGYIVIDWSALPTPTTIQCDDWSEGGLMVSNLFSPRFAYVEGSVEEITEDESVVDGNRKLYNITSPSIIVKADVYEKLVGEINLINTSVDAITFAGNATEKFNGISGELELASGQSCTIIPYDSDFLVTGNFTINLP